MPTDQDAVIAELEPRVYSLHRSTRSTRSTRPEGEVIAIERDEFDVGQVGVYAVDR